ncbi:Uu.00g045860.m01.CDS01 [Anthostomella pinea]|uniref:Uu.00g045860.m01.CDS01 n=1 Tax=Anthostomella pinea TaxID=933095 RepID=A0AAI8VBB8_9PEZI|nr:Uu.00g045860.m01.CDS01 [Anthostomella pinea]
MVRVQHPAIIAAFLLCLGSTSVLQKKEESWDTFDGVQEAKRSDESGFGVVIESNDGRTTTLSADEVNKIIKDACGSDLSKSSIIQRDPDESHDEGDATPAVSPRSLSGPRVINPSGYPYSACGRFDGNNGYSCSVTLVGPRLAVTANHCNQGKAGNSDFGKVYPALYDTKGTYARVDRWLRSKAFSAEADDAEVFDIAVLVLDRDIGHDFGWMDVASRVEDDWTGKTWFQNVAYTDAKDDMKKPVYQEGISFKRGNLRNGAGPLHSDALGYGGSDGSSLWYYRGGRGVIVGVASTLDNRNLVFAGQVGVAPSELTRLVTVAQSKIPLS